jgi:hypothetical protein
MSAIIGIDPGKDETGIVLLDDENLVRATLVSRKGLPQPDSAYLSDIVLTLGEYEAAIAGEVPVIAVEAINAPNPHMGLINPSGALGAAKVFGAVLALWPGAVVVEPDGNGSGSCDRFPLGIRSTKCQKLDRCGCKGSDANRHLRSAYDVAIVGRKMRRLVS